ncbi:hypothetical protein FQN50_004147 [Emmonsiellopsis sp. PD_5]|nr:hypothetical protein FQN50_004147 [Emmonsiellopsis sp. PD_5]
MDNKPTIVLVHGSWHSPSVWTFITPLLEKAGYSVYPILLKSPGMAPPPPDFHCDVDSVKTGIEAVLDTGKDIVLVMHSFGGVVGIEALKGFHEEMINGGNLAPTVPGKMDEEPARFISRRGKILHLAFMGTILLPPGRAMWRVERATPPGFRLDVCIYIFSDSDWVKCTTKQAQIQGETIRVLDGQKRFYNDIPTAAQDHWQRKLKTQPRPPLCSKLSYPAYRHYPSSYLLCSLDSAVSPTVQWLTARNAGIPEDRIAAVDAGHNPMISQPGAVVRFIRRAAGEVVSVL